MAEIKANSLDRYLTVISTFVSLLVFQVKRFLIKFQFLNCNVLGSFSIDSTAPAMSSKND